MRGYPRKGCSKQGRTKSFIIAEIPVQLWCIFLLLSFVEAHYALLRGIAAAPQWHMLLRFTLVGPQTLFTAVITLKIRSVKEQVLVRIVTLLKTTSSRNCSILLWFRKQVSRGVEILGVAPGHHVPQQCSHNVFKGQPKCNIQGVFFNWYPPKSSKYKKS